jgi:hypothetical protein
MTDFYMKFASEQEANDFLFTEKVEVDAETGEEVTLPARADGYSVDVIGTIYKQVGEDEEGAILSPIDGWHVNLRGADNEEFALYCVTPDPSTPYRVWA